MRFFLCATCKWSRLLMKVFLPLCPATQGRNTIEDSLCFTSSAPPVPNDPFPVLSPPSLSFPHGSHSSSALLFTLWGNPFYTSCCSQIPPARDRGSKRRWEVWEPSPRWKRLWERHVYLIFCPLFLFSSVLIVPTYYECVITPLWRCPLRLSSWRMISVLMGSDMIPLMEV